MTELKPSVGMKSVAFLFLSLASPLLCAQRTDTTEVKNGTYGVFQRDERGNPINPVAYYDSTGVLVYHASFRKNVLHGPVIHYDKSGHKTWLVEYKKGQKDGADIYFYPDGSVQWKRSNRKGKVHGRTESFYPNGNTEWTKAYREGHLFGERILRESTGALFNGEYTTVFPLGTGQYTTTCVNGRPYGKLTVFGPKGEVSYIGNYDKGFPEGEFVYYDKEGHITRKEYYKKGEFVNSVEIK